MAPDPGILGEFEEFLKAKRAADQDAVNFDVPLFEKLPDGTERSATLPYEQGKRVLGKWWPDLFGDQDEGDKGDGDKGDKGDGDKPGNPLSYFQGGKRKSS